MRSVIEVFLALLVAAQANAAGSISASKVTHVRIDQDGRGMVTFDQSLGGTPATCTHPAYVNALSFNASTAAGRAIMAMALTAKATGGVISAQGSGTCGVYGGAHVEDWSYGVLH